MFGVIVVGTDGSETANAAVVKAVELAATCGSTLHVVHAQKLVSSSQMGAAASVGALSTRPPRNVRAPQGRVVANGNPG